MKRREAWGCVLWEFLLQRRRAATETQMSCQLSCMCSPESKAQHQCLPPTKAQEGAGDVCRWELGSHGVLQTLWGKTSCFTPHREGTYAPSLQEHQDHRPSLLTWHRCPVLTLGAPGAWMEPARLLSLPFAKAPVGMLLAYVLSPLVLHGYQSITHDVNIPLRNKGWRLTCRQPIQAMPSGNAISQLHVHHHFSCPVTTRRPAAHFWKKDTLGNVGLSMIYNISG